MKNVKLDPSKLLGYRLVKEQGSAKIGGKVGGKIASPAALQAKVGAKVGLKTVA